MIARFFGTFEHTIDPKGRIILPAKFRPAFQEAGAFVTSHVDGCLALWRSEEFELQLQRMHERESLGAMERDEARFWASRSFEVEVDRQGRVAIPSLLRDYASLDGGVIVNGAIDRVELWNPAAWTGRMAPVERHLVEGSSS